jgi:hypothetical protein
VLRKSTKLTQAAGRSARAFGLAGLLLLGCFGIAPPAAKANIFNVSANVSATQANYTRSSSPDVINVFNSLVDIDTVDGTILGGSVNVTDFPSFTTVETCQTAYGFGGCAFFANWSINSYVFLDFTGFDSLAGYAGGPLLPDSFLELSDGTTRPLGVGFVTPEPGFYGVLALGMSGLLFAIQRRRCAYSPPRHLVFESPTASDRRAAVVPNPTFEKIKWRWY